ILLLFDSAVVMQSYLFAYLFWVGISLGCLVILMIQFAVRGTWGSAIRRLLEAGALTLPVMAALIIPILIGMRALYPWARPDIVASDPLLQQKSAYLNVPFFIIRAAIYFAIWSGPAYVLRQWSRRQDTESGLAGRLKNLSIGGALLFTVTAT